MTRIFEFDLITAFNHTSLNISQDDFNSRNPNEFYQAGDLAWMMMSSALILLMIPGAGLFYSGLAEKSSALSMMWLSVMATSVIGVQWFLLGYSIAFTGDNTIWGSSASVAFHTDLSVPWENGNGTKIPQLLHALFQGMFACFTAAIVSGAVIRKEHPGHFLIFIIAWTTLVYDPIARSTWNPIGWSNYWKGKTSGVFDFAGGTVVHIVSATTAAVYSVFPSLRRRFFYKKRFQQADIDLVNARPRPNNVVNIVLGTALLWIGWFGFNGGSALGANLRAVSACVSTHLAACAGGVMGSLMELVSIWRDPVDGRKFSIIGFCNGAVAGLVAITPASGYVPYWSAPIFGIIGSLFCALCQDMGTAYYDTNDIFVIHAVGGWVGMLLTPAFARSYVAAYDGYTVIVNHGWEQLGIQVSDAAVGMIWSGFGSLLILILMEVVTILIRKISPGFQRPSGEGFHLILDRDIIIAEELEELPDCADSAVAEGAREANTAPPVDHIVVPELHDGADDDDEDEGVGMGCDENNIALRQIDSVSTC
ncbi:ammonium transporter AmtB-like domain-containing protein [Tricladium varicosporioides]|nr:ammonium transporter AmtB-like domain-containing protein [Hymenoscyphus varicosporioides]